MYKIYGLNIHYNFIKL